MHHLLAKVKVVGMTGVYFLFLFFHPPKIVRNTLLSFEGQSCDYDLASVTSTEEEYSTMADSKARRS